MNMREKIAADVIADLQTRLAAELEQVKRERDEARKMADSMLHSATNARAETNDYRQYLERERIRADRLAASLRRVCDAAEWMQQCRPSKTRWGLGVEATVEEWEAVTAALEEARKELGE